MCFHRSAYEPLRIDYSSYHSHSLCTPDCHHASKESTSLLIPWSLIPWSQYLFYFVPLITCTPFATPKICSDSNLVEECIVIHLYIYIIYNYYSLHNSNISYS